MAHLASKNAVRTMLVKSHKKVVSFVLVVVGDALEQRGNLLFLVIGIADIQKCSR